MKEKGLVRIIESELKNFKNVKYGDIKYVNYSNAEYRAELMESDVNGIYGQNGSGKTAIIEALDILQHIMSGNTILYEEYAGMFDEKEIQILLSHRPEYFTDYVAGKYDVILSGHAHGGQARLPFLGGVIAPGQGQFPKYDSGVYTEGRSNMVISRGIGNSSFPIRFANRPEVILITLRCD